MSEAHSFILEAPSGRVYELRPLPKHFFIFYGEFPAALTEKAAQAMQKAKPDDFEKVLSDVSPEQLRKLFVFIREAVKFAMVNPKISLDPQNEGEISPAEIPDEDFDFISAWAMKSVGGGGAGTEGLDTFRTNAGKTSANKPHRKALRKTAK